MGSNDKDKEDDGDDLDEEIMALLDYDSTNMETDHLPQFCSHKEKILLFTTGQMVSNMSAEV